MDIACLDLEGVLVPEIWIHVAEATGIEELRLTTRDVADYDELMRARLALLAGHGLRLADIRAVIERMEPLPGALDFLAWLRTRGQVVILSDTFHEFAGPLMARLGHPFLLCHRLDIGADGAVNGYRLRMVDHKRAAVEAFSGLNLRTVAAGDSWNDVSMLSSADAGILFNPPRSLLEARPDLAVANSHAELKVAFERAGARLSEGRPEDR